MCYRLRTLLKCFNIIGFFKNHLSLDDGNKGVLLLLNEHNIKCDTLESLSITIVICTGSEVSAVTKSLKSY